MLATETDRSLQISKNIQQNMSTSQNHEHQIENIPPTLDPPQHPLHDSWTFWYMCSDNKSHCAAENWSKGLIPICTVSSIEAFWSAYSHLQVPSKLRVKNDYMLFRAGIKPEWEDPNNKRGGSWKLVLPQKMRQDKLDTLWTETILSLIGEQYTEGHNINGAYLQRRQKEDKISIWTKISNYTDEEILLNIGQKFKSVNYSESEVNFKDTSCRV